MPKRFSIAYVFVAVCMLACGSRAPKPSTIPHVTVAGADDVPADLRERAQGKPIVLEFWASWCQVCADQLPKLAHFARGPESAGIFVATINVGESRAVAMRHLRRLGLEVPVFTDPKFAFADAIGAREVPTIIVANAAGRIVYRGHSLSAKARAAIGSVRTPSHTP